mmetsp:Transcript_97133/g.302399  ORF Transcript_97133/g.302399 Transcript_97133/m.302399 type:complete len:328 (-) Transcript_97133:644-1627(-)
MLRLSLPLSTETTRTWTSCPTSTSSSTLSTKPSLICVMCTRPSASAPPSAVTVTKAPKGAVRATLPVSHWSECTPSNAERSAGARGAPPPPPPMPGSFMVRPSLFRSMSTVSTRTFTSWPTESSSSTLSTKPSRMREMCTSPLPLAPSAVVTSTNAPKAAMPSTVPSSHSSSGMSTKGVRSTGALAPPPPPTLPSIMESPNLPSSRTSVTQHSTSWPSSTYSWMSFTRSSAMREMCTRPSPVAPMSTKAPKSRTLRTVPVYLAPTSRFSMGIGGYLMLLGLTGESSGPPSGSSHLTWKVPSSFTLMTVPGYICPSSGKTASTSSSTL